MKYAGAFVCLMALVSFAAAQQLDQIDFSNVDPVPRILQEVMGDMGDAAPAGTYGAVAPAAAPAVAPVEEPAVEEPASPVAAPVTAPVEAPAATPAEAPLTVVPAPAPTVVEAPAPAAPVEAPVEAPAVTPAAPEPTPIPETPVVAPAPAVTQVQEDTTCPAGTTMVSYTAGTLYCVLPEAGALEGEVYIAMPGKIAVSSGNKCFASACPATAETSKPGRKMLGTQEAQSTQGTTGAQFLPFLMQTAGKGVAAAPAPAPATTTTTTTTTTYTTSAPAPAQKKLAHSKCFYVCEASKPEAITVMKSNP